jgi:hypothetical protein
LPSLLNEKKNVLKAKLSNCGKILKTNLPNRRGNAVCGTGNDSLYGKNDLYVTIGNPQPSTKCLAYI